MPFGRFAEGLGGAWIWVGASEAIALIIMVSLGVEGLQSLRWGRRELIISFPSVLLWRVVCSSRVLVVQTRCSRVDIARFLRCATCRTVIQ